MSFATNHAKVTATQNGDHY